MATDPDLLLYGIASDVLACARQVVDTTDAGIPEGMSVYVTTGEIAWDNCCPGQLVVSVTRIFSSTTFPSEDARTTPCSPGLTAFDLTIEVLRCAPIAQGSNTAPTVAQFQQSAREVLADAYAVRRGVACCLWGARDQLQSRIGTTQLVGPGGGCVGSSLLVTIGLLDGCLCDGLPTLGGG